MSTHSIHMQFVKTLTITYEVVCVVDVINTTMIYQIIDNNNCDEVLYSTTSYKGLMMVVRGIESGKVNFTNNSIVIDV